MKVRRKPVVMEARLFDPGVDYDAATEIVKWASGIATEEGFVIPTLEGEMTVGPGDWVVKGVQGEFWAIKPDIFEATYEVVEEAPA